jgi:hypothetical protein
MRSRQGRTCRLPASAFDVVETPITGFSGAGPDRLRQMTRNMNHGEKAIAVADLLVRGLGTSNHRLASRPSDLTQ